MHDVIIKSMVERILAGLMTIDDVPDMFREEVRLIIDGNSTI